MINDREWFAERNQISHHCLACHKTFFSHYSRKDLGYCDRCADKFEQGWDIDADWIDCDQCMYDSLLPGREKEDS